MTPPRTTTYCSLALLIRASYAASSSSWHSRRLVSLDSVKTVASKRVVALLVGPSTRKYFIRWKRPRSVRVTSLRVDLFTGVRPNACIGFACVDHFYRRGHDYARCGLAWYTRYHATEWEWLSLYSPKDLPTCSSLTS